MRNMWLVARQEYLKRVSKRSFLLGALGFPLMLLVIITLSVFTALEQENLLPVGYLDHSGILAPGLTPEAGGRDGWLETRSFASEQAARSALEQGEIQAFYILSADYLQSGQVSLYYWDNTPGSSVFQTFDQLVRLNLASNLPEPVEARLVDGYHLTQRSSDGSREIGENDILVVLMPFFMGFIFIMSVMSTAGYMLQVIADEKENRTIEVLLTSLSPEQLIGGKALGLIALSLTLIAIWIVTAAFGLGLAARFIEELQGFRLPWDFLLLGLLFFIPSFALIAGLMTAVGGAVTELRQGQQIAGFMNLIFMVPYFMTGMAFTDPDGPLMVALTLFPTTALVTVTLRWGMTIIPAWQLLLSWVLLVGTAGLSVLASARIFRAGMLMYGKGLDLRAALRAVRTNAAGTVGR